MTVNYSAEWRKQACTAMSLCGVSGDGGQHIHMPMSRKLI